MTYLVFCPLSPLYSLHISYLFDVQYQVHQSKYYFVADISDIAVISMVRNGNNTLWIVLHGIGSSVCIASHGINMEWLPLLSLFFEIEKN